MKASRHFLKRAFLAVLFALSFLACGLFLLVAGLWAQPEWVLNEANAKEAIVRFLPEWRIHWAGFRLEFQRQGLLGKRMNLGLDDLCVRHDPVLYACLPRVRLDLEFSLTGLKPKIAALNQLLIQVSYLQIVPASPTEEEESSFPLPDLRLPSLAFLKNAAQGEIELAVQSFRIGKPEESPLEGTFLLTRDSVPTEGVLAFRGIAKARKNSASLLLPFSGSWGEALKLKAEPNLRSGRQQYGAEIDLLAASRELKLGFSEIKMPGLLKGRRLQARNCRIKAELDKNEGYPRQAELECELSADSVKKDVLIPKFSANASIVARLHRSGKNLVAMTELKAGSKQELFHADLTGKAMLEFTQKWKLRGLSKPDLVINAELPRFERLRALLENTPFAVPAPANSLDGQIELHGRLEHGGESELRFLADLSTRLQGGKQHVHTRGNANIVIRNPLAPRPEIGVEANVVLSDIFLEAPPMRLQSPPRATLDSRFQSEKEYLESNNGKETGHVKPHPIRWKLAVTNEKPVRISSNLLPEPLPLSIDLRLAHDKRPSGTVTLLPVPVEIFHKRAEVDKVKLTLRETSKTIGVDGLLIYRNSEALVKILILGNVEAPRIVLQSEPPLSESQIVSLLLFNKSVQELTEEEAASSSSMGQALSDGAFGLFTLIFLSSTPIESVGYDPVSDTYSVRVRLDGRTSVSVASDFQGERQYAIRRRIGSRWAVSSALQRDEDKGSHSLLTLLEWFHRF